MKAVIPLAQGFEEIEFVTVLDILRRADIIVVVAGLKEGLVEGAHQLKVMADTTLSTIDPGDFDAVILPGGYPGFVNLREDPRVIKLVQDMYRMGKYVAAICGAPSVLIKAGVTKGHHCTVHPSGREEFPDDQYVGDRVVKDGNLITSQAAGTSMEFALKLVAVMKGEQTMRKVKDEVLARI